MLLERIPNISLPAYVDGDIKTVGIESLVQDYLVLVFYPYDFTTVCPTEINEFSHRGRELAEAGAGLAFVSSDSAFSHRAWAQVRQDEGGVQGVAHPMLSDYRKELSQHLCLSNEDGSCKRATVIVDKQLRIRHYSYSDNSVGRSFAETLRLVDALSFCDKTGGMCMVNWEKTTKRAQ